MNDKKFCEVCKSETVGYTHPVFTICSLECLKVLNPKPQKLRYKAVEIKTGQITQILMIEEKVKTGLEPFYSTANRKTPPKPKKRARSERTNPSRELILDEVQKGISSSEIS